MPLEFVGITAFRDYLVAITRDGELWRIVIDPRTGEIMQVQIMHKLGR